MRSIRRFFAEALLAAPGRPEHRQPVKLLVDGQVTERDAAEVGITLEGRTLHTLCLFGEARDRDVLGAYTVEGFGLGIDPAAAA